VHVGATATLPEFRRRGLAGLCVAAVLDDARAAGRAQGGAVLFTGEENRGAQALYERLGFERDVPFELLVLERP
jgi:ribosomal protein S18 acetylase RimI-like enzyme